MPRALLRAVLPRRRIPTPSGRACLVVGVYAGLFVALDRAATHFQSAGGVSLWYPAAGLSVALVLLGGLRYVPALVVVSALAGVFLWNLDGHPLALALTALAHAFGCGVVPALAARRLDLRLGLPRPRDVAVVALLALAAPVLAGGLSVGAYGVLGLLPWDAFGSIFRDWWVGDAIGVLTIAPLALVATRFAAVRSIRRPRASRCAIVALQVALLGGAIWAAFASSHGSDLQLLYVCFVPLAWIALDHGLPGAALAGLGLAVAGAIATTAVGASLIDVQGFTIGTVLTGLVLGAVIDDRKRKTAAIEDAGERLWAIFESSPLPTLTLDRAGRVTAWNSAAEDLFGWSAEEVLGRSPPTIPEDLRSEYEDARRAVFESGRVRRLVTTRTTRAGATVDVSLHLAPLVDVDGQVTGHLSVLRDIGEQQRAQESMERRDAVLATIGHGVERFLRGDGFRELDEEINRLLAELLVAADASRAFVFENIVLPDGELGTRQRLERVAPGIPSDLSNEVLQAAPYGGETLTRWRELLAAGKPLEQRVQDVPPEDRALFTDGVWSIAVAPIFVGERWWGYAGFDECRGERVWGPLELGALKTVAGLIGALLERAGADAALHESEERFRAMADDAPVMIWVADEHGKITFVNRRSLEFVGHSHAGGFDWLEDVHPDDRAGVLQAWKTGLVDETDYEITFRLRRADGEWRWMIDRGVARRAGERFIGMLGTTTDITDSKRAATELERRGAMLEAVGSAAERFLREKPDPERMTGFLRTLGMAADASRAWLFENVESEDGSVLGRQLSEWAAPGVSAELANPAFQALEYLEVWAAPLARGEVVQHHARDLQGADREILESQGVVSVVLVPIFAGGKWWGIVGFDECRDTREWSDPELDALKAAAGIIGAAVEAGRAERALQVSEERFRSTFEDAAVGMAVVALDGMFLRVNQALCDLVGYTEEELLARRVKDITHPDDVEENLRSVRRLLGGEARAFRIEKRYLHKDGRLVWVVLNASLVRDIAARPLHFVAEMQDITERRAAEEAREQLLAYEREQVERLRELDRMKDAFVATVSHELRTPLTNILGYLGLLIETADESDDRELLGVIERNATRLLSLVNDLLVVARLHSGGFEIEREPVDLGQVAVEALENAAPRAAQRGLEVAVDLQPVSGFSGDPVRLSQLLDNLVSNAIKFTPTGGRVSVRVFPDGAAAVVEVEDTGMGISEADQERLFERFFRTDEAQRQAIQGTGLGLTIVSAIVEAHGGSVSVSSAVGEGTTFRVTFPLDGVEELAA